MGKERLTEKQIVNARNDLHLKMSACPSPFELSEEESKYRPDDWTWLFLRLSSEYEQSYKAHADGEDEDLSHSLIDQQPFGIKPDHDRTCAEDFGLAFWLPPSEKALPKLKEENDSWFFPLKRPVVEDYRRTEVGDHQYHRPWSRYSS